MYAVIQEQGPINAEKQYLSIAHISLTILQMFLVFMMLVNVVKGVC